jgi:type I restriction-modification system DNA methylase subunit
MASVPPPDSPTDSLANTSDSDSHPLPHDVVARVTFHTTTQSSTSKGKKGKTTTTKEPRAKEFSYTFAPTQANYLAFLQTILDKHHLSKYKVSDQVVFPCKVQVPPRGV